MIPLRRPAMDQTWSVIAKEMDNSKKLDTTDIICASDFRFSIATVIKYITVGSPNLGTCTSASVLLHQAVDRLKGDGVDDGCVTCLEEN